VCVHSTTAHSRTQHTFCSSGASEVTTSISAHALYSVEDTRISCMHERINSALNLSRRATPVDILYQILETGSRLVVVLRQQVSVLDAQDHTRGPTMKSKLAISRILCGWCCRSVRTVENCYVYAEQVCACAHSIVRLRSSERSVHYGGS
jgi:hypothetical protein